MTTTIIEDAPVLIPNQDHQNFTFGKEVIKKDTEVTGNPKTIIGLRRGEPFTYKLFLTNDNKLIHLNKIKKMETKSAVNGATIINLKQNVLAKPAILVAIGGAVAGFGLAKYRKLDNKKAAIYALVGAAAGFAIGKFIQHKGTVKIAK